ncbi:MAG: hypothetical protein ACOH1O_09655 [Flavobacterium sp.]
MKNSFFIVLTILFLGKTTQSIAQDQENPIEKYTAHNKGKFFVNWGGNIADFSKSNINFKGANYDFTLANVVAEDKPKGLHIDYINPLRMTIPQTNFRMGYYFTDKYSISLGVDHMKYVVVQNQTVNITGTIDGVYYDNQPKVLTEDFLKFEHTDGLNYVNTELTRLDDISKIFNLNTDHLQVNTVVGAGIGLLYPKTNTTLMGKERYDQFHISGYGASIKAGLNLTFLKHFYVQAELKGGYINMPDIRTTHDKADSASQHFNFLQQNIVLGGIFRI